MAGMRYVVSSCLAAGRHTRGLADLLSRREASTGLRGLPAAASIYCSAMSTDSRAPKQEDAVGQKENGKPRELKELVMVFTCGQCNTRAAKSFSKASYERGVVIVECPGCSSKHLIADHLGWFGAKGTVEDFAKEKGNVVLHKLADGTMELTPEDVLGTSLAQKILSEEHSPQ